MSDTKKSDKSAVEKFLDGIQWIGAIIFGAQFKGPMGQMGRAVLKAAAKGTHYVERLVGHNLVSMLWKLLVATLVFNALGIVIEYNWFANENGQMLTTWGWLALALTVVFAIPLFLFVWSGPWFVRPVQLTESLDGGDVTEDHTDLATERQARDTAVLAAEQAFAAEERDAHAACDQFVAQRQANYNVHPDVVGALDDYDRAILRAENARATAAANADTARTRAQAVANALSNQAQQGVALRAAENEYTNALGVADRTRAAAATRAERTRDARLTAPKQTLENAKKRAETARDNTVNLAKATRDNAVKAANNAFEVERTKLANKKDDEWVKAFEGDYGSPRSALALMFAIFAPTYAHAVILTVAAVRSGSTWWQGLLLLIGAYLLKTVADVLYKLIGTFVGWTVDGPAQFVYSLLGESAAAVKAGFLPGEFSEDEIERFRTALSPFVKAGGVIRQLYIPVSLSIDMAIYFAIALFSVEGSIAGAATGIVFAIVERFVESRGNDLTETRKKSGWIVGIIMLVLFFYRLDVEVDAMKHFTHDGQGHIHAFRAWAYGLSQSADGGGIMGLIAVAAVQFMRMRWYMAIVTMAFAAAAVLWLVKHVEPKTNVGHVSRGLAVLVCAFAFTTTLIGFSADAALTQAAQNRQARVLHTSPPAAAASTAQANTAPSPAPTPASPEPGILTRMGRFVFGAATDNPAPATQAVPAPVVQNSNMGAPSRRDATSSRGHSSDPCSDMPPTTRDVMRRRGRCS